MNIKYAWVSVPVTVQATEPSVPNPQPATEIRLTPRQRQVCEHLTRGCSDKEISAVLGISESTVDFHLRKLFAKFGAQSRSAVAVAYTVRKRSLCERVAIGGRSRVATLDHDIAA